MLSDLREFLFGVARVLGDFSPRMRYDLLERSIVRAKATRSVSLLKLKARCAFNASSVASAPRPRERSFVALFLNFFNDKLAFYYARLRNSRWKSTGLPT